MDISELERDNILDNNNMLIKTYMKCSHKIDLTEEDVKEIKDILDNMFNDIMSLSDLEDQ